MASSKKLSANLLPEFLQTDKNLKFLSSTIDPLLETPQLERIDGFVGNKFSPNFNSLTDFYINQPDNIRTNYSLEPALIINNDINEPTSVYSFDDVLNYFKNNDRNIDNFNKLFNIKTYSFDPLIDWDKFINFSEYYWLPKGPDTIILGDTCIDVDNDILNKSSYLMSNGYYLSNGMKIKFLENTLSSKYFNKTFLVDGVGNKIKLIDFDLLIPDRELSSVVNETFDTLQFDEVNFDGDIKLPLIPEYITISKTSKDLNSWSRYNRWFHVEVIKNSALINNKEIDINYLNRAQRPIIEFKSNLQLLNFGKNGIKNVDLIDVTTTNAFKTIQNSVGYYVDGELLQPGYRVIFNNDEDLSVRGKIFVVTYNLFDNNTPKINLVPADDFTPDDLDSMAVNYGNEFIGKSFYYNAEINTWILAQQHTFINQEPIFDLFDKDGISYSKILNNSNFQGNKIFGYEKSNGINDSILGFSLKYKNNLSVGSYLFKNYFMTDVIEVIDQANIVKIPTAITYLKINDESEILVNVWNKESQQNQIPVLETKTLTNTTNTFLVESVSMSDVNNISVYINNIKQNVIEINTVTNFVKIEKNINTSENVLLKLFTEKIPNDKGYYEPPISLTNNPLNELIESVSFTELIDHYKSMVDTIDSFSGNILGSNNLRDIYNYARLGKKIILNVNPISFTKFFLLNKDHNPIDAFRISAEHYNQFKMNLIRHLSSVSEQETVSTALDTVMYELTKNNTERNLYYRSDMIGFGNNKSVIQFNVVNTNITEYPFNFDVNFNKLNNRCLLVYLNDEQLLLNYDYTVNEIENYISFSKVLSLNDTISIVYYQSTFGNYIPPTPTKLGLYPKFKPEIFYDNTFANGPTKMIRGHDGSLIKAFSDYRDNIILEYEKRIYNNIKINYNNKFFDVISIQPGAFRITDKNEFNKILNHEFLLWAGKYNVEYEKNTTYIEDNYKTWNYKNSIELLNNSMVSGTWKALFKHFFDTVEPNNKPWEMLGFSEMPQWWTNFYGLPPYNSTNSLLWQDLEQGYNRFTATVDNNYARPGLSNFIPVDENGILKNPQDFLTTTNTFNDRSDTWNFGDFSPVEVSWRNSSYYPYAINVASSLINPSDYLPYMYDVSRIDINPLGQLIYKNDDLYLNLKKLVIEGENDQQISGFGSYLFEIGNQKKSNYSNLLRNNLNNISIKLFHKLGGFTSKEKIQLTIDSLNPNSQQSGIFLSEQDYDLIYNVSTPTKILNISGIIVQKNNGKFIVKGYDKLNPYFKIFPVEIKSKYSTVSVGGTSEKFSEWSSTIDLPGKNINTGELTTANSVTTKYYKVGQIVRYENKFYRVKVGHNANSTFEIDLFQPLPELPKKGGITVKVYNTFSDKEETISYGTEFNTPQDVYNFILGYGNWLERQGFIFDQYNVELNEVINWKFSGKEFLFWNLQNWSDNNLITLSPFANNLKYKNDSAIVDSILNPKYDYIILKADGNILDKTNLSFSRNDQEFEIVSTNQYEGLFFASIRLIQKENGLIFNNFSTFNDLIYDTKTGYRQQRVKITGFRTKNWNGDLFSPGFIFDDIKISDWKQYQAYTIGDVVKYKDQYYQSNNKNLGTDTFDFAQWKKLNKKPKTSLIPNFDYKISQFEDFYSLDIDNFDINQQLLSQNLIGYNPRTYLNNIIFNPVSQYKFYQGFIKEKGTKNPINKLANLTQNSIDNKILINEEWAFRTGFYGGYVTYNELEFTLDEKTYLENPYIIKFVDQYPEYKNELINLKHVDDLLLKSDNYEPINTFNVYKGTFDDTNLVLPNAGYVRFDDVTATAYNKNSILDIFNNDQIINGTTVWTGFLENGDWTVYRYFIQEYKIAGVFVQSPGNAITFVTDIFHNLKIGDIVSVVNFNNQVNGIYIVTDIPKLDQFTVASDLTTIVNEELMSLGSLFKFENSRFSSILDLKDENIFKLPVSTKFWIDNDLDQKWVVLEKENNFNYQIVESIETSGGQLLGNTIYTNDNIDVLIVSSPGNRTQQSYSIGKIAVFNKNDVEKKFEYELNSLSKTFSDSTSTCEFGFSITYSKNKNLFIVGAPGASNVNAALDTGVVISTGTAQAKSFVQEGLVKISTADSNLFNEIPLFVINNPNALTTATANYSRFGHSVFLFDDIEHSTLVIGAPGTQDYSGPGKVYAYNLIKQNSGEISVVENVSTFEIESTSTVVLNNGSNWGYSISGSKSGDTIAISAPYYQNTTSNFLGIVQVFDKNLNWLQNLLPSLNEEYSFGFKTIVSNSGNYILVSTIDLRTGTTSFGKIFVFKFDKKLNSYNEIQILNNPSNDSSLKYGYDISLSENEKILTISSLGTLKSKEFDFVNFNNEKIIFDNDTTTFVSTIENSGNVYVYEKIGDYFVQTIDLNNNDILQDSKFGKSIISTNDSIFVGAPYISGVGVVSLTPSIDLEIDINQSLILDIEDPTQILGVKPLINVSYTIMSETTKQVSKIDIISNGSGYTKIPLAFLTNNTTINIPLSVKLENDNSRIYKFKLLDPNFVSLKEKRVQEDLVDISTIKKVSLINNLTEDVLEYLEVVDPLKGKIVGIADQELTYKIEYDPAIYSFGLIGTMNDPENSWLDEHVGELWWDLSNTKFIWYEQGEELYRKNNWGQLFPGSAIDIYEWVKSDLLPSEWAAIADTNDGLIKGISGQPKYPDNTVISVKQIFNNVTGTLENVYYFWVKNKTLVPNVINRRKSAFEVANLIADPVSNGVKFVSILSKDAIALANIQQLINNDKININIVTDINSQIPRHTEWILLEEGNPNSLPNTLLEKKLFDSLIGQDRDKNLVPDPSLNYRNKYGLGIRPQQTLFKNKIEALRNVVDFSNSILIKNKITDNYDFINLLKEETIPDINLGEYDEVVVSNVELLYIDTSKFKKANISCFIQDKKIRNIIINDPGYGYKLPPAILVSDVQNNVRLQSIIDSDGKLVEVKIINSGDNLPLSVTLEVRNHAVIVSNDQTSNNKWAKYEFNYELRSWYKTRTQLYNTPLYWKYTNWKSEKFKEFKNIKYTVPSTNDLLTLIEPNIGDYIKVKNSGNGNYIIVEKISNTINLNNIINFEVVFIENGTFIIKDEIWNYNLGNFNYDKSSVDQLLYDQTPSLEIFYILTALKENIFIDDLKINWNLLFFTAVKYALTEQKNIDWAFKTSFVSVKNNVGNLNQTPLYKITNDEYFEEFIKEIKPYKTKIRNYVLAYSNLENSNTFISDFDLPSYYDNETQTYNTVNENDLLINEYPWKSWKDNNTFYLEKILISDPGKGYSQRPLVTIQSNDTGTGATAEAYIRNGGVVGINILNPGYGYKIPPTIIITDVSGNVTRPAKVSAVLSNYGIRKNLLKIKFDRISSRQEILTNNVNEKFICDGKTKEFNLKWPPSFNKEKIIPLLDGRIIFATDYTILYLDNVAKFVFLNYIPSTGQIFEITYLKNYNFYNATDRIINFYTPDSNNDGKELALLMDGISYPNTVIQGLPFDIVSLWNPPNNPFGNFIWDELTEFNSNTRLVGNLNIGDNVIYLEDVSNISTNQIVKILNTSSSILRQGVSVKTINTTNNSIVLNTSTFLIKNVYADNTSSTATITLISKTNINGLLNSGDIIVVSGIVTNGYDGIYNIDSIVGNDIIKVTANNILGNEVTTILSTASIEVSNVIQPLVYDSLLLDEFHVNTTSTSTISVKTFSSLTDISKIEITVDDNLISNTEILDTYFSTSTYTIFDRLEITIHNLDVNVESEIVVKLFTYYKIEFWKNKVIENSLDSVIIGGTWDGPNLLNGLGIEPADLIVDGNTFVSANVNYGPEELIKGHVLDSLGINVYTRAENVSGLSFTGIFSVSLTTITNFVITADMYDYSSLMVYSDRTLFERINSLNFTGSNQYYIEGNSVYIPPQPDFTKIGYTVLATGGGNILDSNIIFVSDVDFALVESLVNINDVRSAYVTVDGVKIDEITDLNNYGYVLEASNINSNRASVKIYNLPLGNHSIQVWFLNSLITEFSLIYEEYFENDVSSPIASFMLSRPTTQIEPISNQYFVEAFFTNTGVKKQLKPPKVTYYTITNNLLTYNFENDVIRPSNYYEASEIKVYINGAEIRPGFDVNINVVNNTITLVNGLFNNGDVIAISLLKDFEFIIQGNTFLPQEFANKYRIISINDNNVEPLLRTELFNYIPINRYKLSRPILNDNYLWVYVNGTPLIHRYDFEILEDNKTIQLSEWIDTDINSEIMIINLNFKNDNYLIGYRIFKNIFDKFEFKRLSQKNTTKLVKELFKTDSEIFVENDNVLMTPNKELNKPGVVLIDGERIEFFKKENNVLSELRRFTFGTSSPEYSQVGSTVIDQSVQQSLPYVEEINIQKIISTNTNTYYISTQTSTSTGQGIILNDNISFENQVMVFFGGKQLRKNNLKIQDVEFFNNTNDSTLINLEKEFLINKDESNLQILKLNFDESNIVPGVEIAIVQKKGYIWTGTESFLTSEEIQPKFLRLAPAELPDNYYYGGFKEIVDVSYDPLTDENDEPLEE